MSRRRTHAPTTALAVTLLLAGCVSDFGFELPEHHPARPTCPPSGPLEVPDPFALDPPLDASADGEDVHDMHGDHREPADDPDGHGGMDER